mmetsp:Transcript_32182/g.49208  ORF Transcript_32182/g.49208 Transcript_32182/m.49208 type:complete len:151 (-) Transcript_32182:186-638(-)
MKYMFYDTLKFNQPLNSWDVSSVTDMSIMFVDTLFNYPLDSWDVSKVKDTYLMFHKASEFNQPLDSWDMSSVTVMSGMFSHANFNYPLASWDVSQVVDFQEAFYATPFNQDLCAWYPKIMATATTTDMFAASVCPNQADPTAANVCSSCP